MTPGQLGAALELAQARYRRGLSDTLAVHAVAAQGDRVAIEDQIKALSK